MYQNQELLFQNTEGLNKGWFSAYKDLFKLSDFPGWPDKLGAGLYQFYKNYPKIKTLSLFSGAGGLDIGFHDVGFEVVECNELEPAFSKTLLLNSKKGYFNSVKIHCKDIREFTPASTHIDLIIGGPPCQTFSAAGARAAGVNGTDDDRGNLFWEYVRILKLLKPKAFLFENVYRIVGAQNGKAWGEIQKAFSSVGYSLHWRILDAADYGVPQFRERLIIVGTRNENYLFPSPSHGPDSQDNNRYYSAKSAIEGLENEFPNFRLSGRHGHLLTDIPPGLNYSFYTDRMGHPEPIFAWRSKFSDYLYKADPQVPVRTIKAQGGQYTGPFHWDNRPFSVAELKRLQTFPDSYEISGNRQIAIHQIGNSVPPQFARILALSIRQQLFDGKVPSNIKLLPKNASLGFRARKSALTQVYQEKAERAISKSNFSKSKDLLNSQGTYYCQVQEDLLFAASEEAVYPNIINYTLTENIFTISLNACDNSQSTLQYYFEIKLKIATKSNLPTKIILNSYLSDRVFLVTLWKALEFLVKRFYHKDDLIQLFGYYQYEGQYLIDFHLNNPQLEKDTFWESYRNLIKQSITGKIIPLNELSFNMKIDEDILYIFLRELKKIGFEIRSNNTNKQIKPGNILIPYQFPTLNERSLQRFTNL